MEGAVSFYNLLNQLDMLFPRAVDKTVENEWDKMCDQGF